MSARAVLAAALVSAMSFAMAEEGSIRILVGFPPGGGSDLIARIIADPLKAALGAPVVVENRPGVNGVLAADALRSAPADGRTFMVSPIAVTVFAPLVQPGLRYDPEKDFAPVSLAATYQLALAVGPGSPARTVDQYIAWVRTNPANAQFGMPTAGGPPHFFGVMLAKATGLDLSPVPYKGGGPLVSDLIGGQLPAAITVVGELLGHHRSGRLRILASSGAKRSPGAPDVPTFKELGFAAIEGDGWQAVHAKAGSPRTLLERASAAIAAALRRPEVRDRLIAADLEPVGNTPDELAQRMREDTARWAPIVKASGFRMD